MEVAGNYRQINPDGPRSWHTAIGRGRTRWVGILI